MKLPNITHDSDAYQGLHSLVRHFMSSSPLVGILKRSKLSRRHWEELLDVSTVDAPQFPVHDIDGSLHLKVCGCTQFSSVRSIVLSCNPCCQNGAMSIVLVNVDSLCCCLMFLGLLPPPIFIRGKGRYPLGTRLHPICENTLDKSFKRFVLSIFVRKHELHPSRCVHSYGMRY